MSKFANLDNDAPLGFFVNINEVWAERCHKLQLGIEGITHSLQSADIMRYELKELIKETSKEITIISKYSIGSAKLMSLYSALSDLSQKFENGNYQIKNLNPAERQQLSSLARKI